MNDSEVFFLEIFIATQQNELPWQPTPSDDGFQTALAGVECTVCYDEDRETFVLIIRDDQHGDKWFGEAVEELFHEIHRQKFYRRTASKKFLSALKAKVTGGVSARH